MARPVPTAAPCTAPTTGSGQSWMAKNAARTSAIRSSAFSGRSVVNSPRSLPAQKCFPWPASTIAFAPASCPGAPNSAAISRYIS